MLLILVLTWHEMIWTYDSVVNRLLWEVKVYIGKPTCSPLQWQLFRLHTLSMYDSWYSIIIKSRSLSALLWQPYTLQEMTISKETDTTTKGAVMSTRFLCLHRVPPRWLTVSWWRHTNIYNTAPKLCLYISDKYILNTINILTLWLQLADKSV